MPRTCLWILRTCLVCYVLARLTTARSMGQYDGPLHTIIDSISSSSNNNNNNNILASQRQLIPAPSGPDPEFARFETIVQVAPSQMAALPCSVRNLGDRQVVWRRLKDDEFLTIGKLVWSKDPRILVEFQALGDGVTSWDLLLRNVGFDDAGIYECQVTSAEQLVWHVELKVVDPVTSRPKSRVHKQVLITQAPYVTAKMQSADHQRPPSKEEYVTAGLPIRLMCNTSVGNQSLPHTTTIEWFKDGQSLQSSQHVLLTRYQFESDLIYVSELMIDKSRLADSGEYLCRMLNNDLYVVKIYVLPNTTISSSSDTEDQSPYYGVDSLKNDKEAHSSSSHPSPSWAVLLLYSLCAFYVITQFSLSYGRSDVSCYHKNSLRVDPT